jgi:hypothetical protein
VGEHVTLPHGCCGRARVGHHEYTHGAHITGSVGLRAWSRTAASPHRCALQRP